MPKIRLPAGNWQPRPYQRKAWDYLENGGRYASLVWHRRSGKDEICLRHIANQAMVRPGNYWHLLPIADQARKVLWEAVNPATGMLRIDEAFPHTLRSRVRNDLMSITFKSGSTWQAVGSDNYRSLVGAPPVGLVLSEWSKADPRAWAHLSPIIVENKGFAIFPTTPNGKNHAYRTHLSFEKDPNAFAQILPATQTDKFTAKELAEEKQRMIDFYGATLGSSYFEQEYLCSFEAAILGAVYATEVAELRASGRIREFEPANAPVYTAWDIGRTDATAIWWFQIVGGELRILDYQEDSLKNLDFYSEQITGRRITNDISEWGYSHLKPRWGDDIDELGARRKYEYGMHFLPHDAKHKRLEASGVSTEQILRKTLNLVQIVQSQGMQASAIRAGARAMLRRAWFTPEAAEGLEILGQYHFDYNEERRQLSDKPVHDWTSHCANSWEYLSIAASNLLATQTAPKTRSRNRNRKRENIWTA